MKEQLHFLRDKLNLVFCTVILFSASSLVAQKIAYQPTGAYNITKGVLRNSFSVNAQETQPTGVTFSSDGTKMYVIGYTGNDVNEYDLGTAWDVSTAVFLQNFSVVAEENGPQAVRFNEDGTKMFVLGSQGDDVNEYNLGTAWDVSTSVYSQNFSVATEDTAPSGLWFNYDGTKMYVSGDTGNSIYEYNLGTGFDVSTAVYSQNFSVAAEEGSVQDVAFNLTGTKMFIVGFQNDRIREYDLGTNFDISTAVYTQELLVSGNDNIPTGIVFHPTGKSVYLIGRNTDSIYEYNMVPESNRGFVETANNDGSVTQSIEIHIVGDTFADVDADNVLDLGTEVTVPNLPAGLTASFTLSIGDTVATMSLSGNATNHADADDLADLQFTFLDAAFTGGSAIAVTNATGPASSTLPIEFNDPMSQVFYQPQGAFDSYGAIFNNSFSVAVEEVTPTGFTFNNNGTKLFVVGATGDDVNEYNVGTAYDLSTAVYFQNFSVVAQENNPEGITFNPDGTKMFIVGSSGDDINEYVLNTGFDVSTATYVQNFSVAAQDTNPNDVFFKYDGSKMYVVGDTNNSVYEYSLTSPYNIGTATFVQALSVTAEETVPEGLEFNPQGTKMFVIGSNGDDVNQYNLATAWDISTATFENNFYIGLQDTAPSDVFFNGSGTKMYISGWTGDTVDTFDVVSSNDLGFVESGTNDGSVLQSLSMVLVGDTFADVDADNLLDYTTEFTIPNLPAGLAVSAITLSLGDTVATFSLTGNATNHADANDLAQLQFTFLDAAFTNNAAADVDAATGPANSGVPVNFMDSNARVYYQPKYAYEMNGFVSFSQNFSVAAQETVPTGIAFSTDGTKMFIVGSTGDDVNEYNLGTAFDVSTAVYV
ncbi:MAG: hypothetical protein H6584_06815, partial [Flavobacteriales bacterium]|nr:hypothetical protein [Flavobacteriales bacterium]